MQRITIASSDGFPLAARVYAPPGPPHGSVVIAAAMGVRQQYYADFAEWLATQGWRVTTFDYRGSGDSAPRKLRGFHADLFDWTRDYEAVIDHAHAELPDQPLYLLGHSLGAQLPGLLANQDKVSGLLGVAAGSGYWRELTPRMKRSTPWFWHVIVPVATRMFGYYPGRRLRLIGDLPAGVALQWRRWCLSPRYSVGAEGEPARRAYARARFPVVALSISDDEMMTPTGIASLVALYENAPREVRSITPAEFGVRRIGHFGAFRHEQATRLWPRMADCLNNLATQRTA